MVLILIVDFLEKSFMKQRFSNTFIVQDLAVISFYTDFMQWNFRRGEGNASAMQTTQTHKGKSKNRKHLERFS